MSPEMHIEYASDDQIDEDCYQFIEEITGAQGCFISNESILDEFMPEEEIPGHDWRPLSQVPDNDRGHYLSHKPPTTNPDRYVVFYPPLSPDELLRERQKLLNKLEITYLGVSFVDYPVEEPLYVWKLVVYLRNHGIKFIPNNP